MSSVNQFELDKLSKEIDQLAKARLQEVRATSQDWGFGFWSNQQLEWVWIDLHPHRLFVGLIGRKPVHNKKPPEKPIWLFIRSHFINRHFSHAEVVSEWGRVLRLYFFKTENESTAPYIEVRLFPQGRNLIAHANGKTVALSKPQKLTAPPPGKSKPERDLSKLKYEWQKKYVSQKSSSRNETKEAERALKRQIKKTQRAIQKVEQGLADLTPHKWRQVGEYLQQQKSLPRSLQAFYDSTVDFAENMERAFEKAKSQESKMKGQTKRLEELKNELKSLEAVEDPLAWWGLQQGKKSLKSPQKTLLKKAGVRGRTLPLEDGLQAYLGKNARENLQLLRQAQPWHWWVHLRDYPSSHAIIQREKKQPVPLSVMRRVAEWLIAETFAQKPDKVQGQKFQVVAAECRYVRPIKGDRAGRVQYHNEKTFQVAPS